MESFDVTVEALHAGAASLGGDAESLAAAAGVAVAAVGAAGSSVCGGPLAQASAEFATVLGDWAGHCGAATGAAGAGLRRNAVSYAATDEGAASGLGVVTFDAGVTAGRVAPIDIAP